MSATTSSRETSSLTISQVSDDILKISTKHSLEKASRYGIILQILRGISLGLIFAVSCICIILTQLIGCPLYYYNQDIYHAWMDYTKQSFGILLTFCTQIFTPTTMKISGDESMKGMFAINPFDKTLETKFGDKAIIIANHQIYSDWIYLWWFAFTAQVHGGVYIMLKKSLEKIPLLGWGMKNYNFIFLSRKFELDHETIVTKMASLNKERDWPTWLLLFPEGTNLSGNTRKGTVAYAAKMGYKLPKHVLLPRTTGLRLSLLELNGSIDYLFDCTMAYEGVTPEEYGQDIFTLKACYLGGNFPKSVSCYWRRFKISNIPYEDETKFEEWVYKIWHEKDELMDNYYRNGDFGASTSLLNSDESDKIMEPMNVEFKVNVQLRNILQFFQVLSVPLTFLLLANSLIRQVKRFM
ncbi:acyltransferase-domain-containing protein [Nadsonia fulvescens var. elongata DSM 6958]|uniref:Acyltransferase-domain-containing protein n=1 Tax=Nadsonia fulvescens var. elongata DSM 6958 TaxID=857566 RepID=A0A1E3PPF8_9ASCO|nr:acyltransferase-domain-containing protein [Nadsonia fulvescens var. elongata DSM 6958]